MSENGKTAFIWNDIRYAIAYERSPIAFKRLFSEFHQELFLFGMSIIKAKEPVEDIIADIFLKVWLMESKLLEIEKIKTYLFIAVKNNSLKYLQSQPHVIDISTLPILELKSTSVEETYISKENLQIIQIEIDKLPPKCKMAFILVKDLGHSYIEAAEIMEIAVNTVDRHIQLAIKRLRQSLSTDKLSI